MGLPHTLSFVCLLPYPTAFFTTLGDLSGLKLADKVERKPRKTVTMLLDTSCIEFLILSPHCKSVYIMSTFISAILFQFLCIFNHI